MALARFSSPNDPTPEALGQGSPVKLMGKRVWLEALALAVASGAMAALFAPYFWSIEVFGQFGSFIALAGVICAGYIPVKLGLLYYAKRQKRSKPNFFWLSFLSPLLASLYGDIVALEADFLLEGMTAMLLVGGAVMITVLIAELWLGWMSVMNAHQETSERNLDHSIARALVIAFFGGISVITVVGLTTIESNARARENSAIYAELINIAGRQRMLAQSIGRAAALEASEHPTIPLQTRLTTFINEAEQVDAIADQIAVRHDVPAFVLTQMTRTAADRATLVGRVEAFQSGGSLAAVQAAVDVFVPSMNQLVGRFEDWSDETVRQQTIQMRGMEVLEALIALLTALILAFPLVRISKARFQTVLEDSVAAQRLSLVAQHTNNIVLITDIEGRLQWANEAFTDISGYELIDVLGRKPGSFLQNANTDPDTIKRVADALKNRRGIRTEILNVDRSGREYWLDMDIRPIRDAQGECTGFIAVETDVTQQVGLRTHLNRVYQATPAGIVIQDSDGAIIDCNTEAERLLYMTRDQMMGRTSLDPTWRAMNDDEEPLTGEEHPAMVTLRTGRQVRGFVMGVKSSDHPRRWLQVNTIALPSPGKGEPAVIATFLDISEQRDQRMNLERANAETQNALASLQAYQDALSRYAILSVTDVDGTILEVNDAFCRISGYSKDELIGENHRLLRSGEHPDSFYAAMWRSLTSGGAWRGEVCNRAKDGSLYWVDTIMFAIESEGNADKRYVSVRFDITRRKRAENLVRESETRMQLALELSNAEAWDVNLATGAMSKPRSVKTELGMTLARTGSIADMLRRVHPEDRPMVIRRWRSHLEGKEEFDAEHRLLLADQRYRWVRTSARLEAAANGDEYVYGVTQDIREAKLHEAMLKAAESEAEDRYLREGVLTDALLDAMSDMPLEAFLAKATKSLLERTKSLEILNKAGVFQMEEDNDVQRLRLMHSENLGPGVEGLCATVQMGHCLCGRAAQTGKLVHADCVDERHEIRPEGMKPHGHYNVPLKVSGDVVGVLVVYLQHGHQIDDIEVRFLKRFGDILALGMDRRRRMTELAEARRIAEAAAKSKAEFLATMSHEIRTPMNGVLGMLELLTRSQLDEKQHKWAKIASQSADSLLTIINDILDLSKIEAGRMDLEALEFSPTELATEVGELLRAKADEKGLELRVETTRDVPERFVTDPTRVRQVLFNLVGNGVKFTETGRVTILVKASDRFDRPGLRVEIQDTGIGISEEARKELFQPFSQADSSTTRRFGGTGLGLAICRRLVAMMGGEIGLDSVEGEGSTFWFELPPLAEASEVEAVAPEQVEEEEDLQKLSILVAEDNPLNQQVMQGLFGEDHDLTIVENGQAAIEALSNRSFHLVLMDIHMPVMDGETATRKIRSTGNHIPIIALTADADMASAERYRPIGFNGVVLKPLKIRQLFTEMSRVLGESDDDDAADDQVSA